VTEQRAVLSDEQLERNFAEIAPPLTSDAALLEANQCLFCHDALPPSPVPHHRRPRVHQEDRDGQPARLSAFHPPRQSVRALRARLSRGSALAKAPASLNDRDEQPIKIALLQRHATDYVLERKLSCSSLACRPASAWRSLGGPRRAAGAICAAPATP
jgi:glutamate synthase (NADPH/NADH) small chain